MIKIYMSSRIIAYFNTFLFFILFICGCEYSKDKKSMTALYKSNLSQKSIFQSLNNTYYAQNILNNDSNKYCLYIKNLNDSIISLKFIYFEKFARTKLLYLQSNRDSNFVCYYNINNNQFIGIYSKSQVLDSSRELFSIKLNNEDLYITLKSKVFQSRIFHNEKFTRQELPIDEKIFKDGHLFYVYPGTRYFYRLKKDITKDTKIQNIECYNGCSRFEKKILIPKQKFIESSEVVTNIGNGYFYDVLDGTIFKLMLIGFGDTNDTKYGITSYTDQVWITVGDFYNYFERF